MVYNSMEHCTLLSPEVKKEWKKKKKGGKNKEKRIGTGCSSARNFLRSCQIIAVTGFVFVPGMSYEFS